MNNGGCAPDAVCRYTGPGTSSCVQTGLGNTSPDAGTEQTVTAAYEYGTRFIPQIAVSAVGIRYYRSPGMTAAREGWLFDGSGNFIQRIDLPSNGTGWQDGWFPVQRPLTAGQTYTVSMDTSVVLGAPPYDVVYDAPGLLRSASVTDGPILYPQMT